MHSHTFFRFLFFSTIVCFLKFAYSFTFACFFYILFYILIPFKTRMLFYIRVLFHIRLLFLIRILLYIRIHFCISMRFAIHIPFQIRILFTFVQSALAKSRSTRRSSRRSAFMGNCPIISHTCSPYLPSGWVHLFVPGVTRGNEDAAWIQGFIFFISD